MTSQPATPVRVPKAVKQYSPATQDPDLRSQINGLLLRDGHVDKIQTALSHALSSHPSNFPSSIATRAIQLLRSGEHTTFPSLLAQIIAEVKAATEDERQRVFAEAGMPTSTGASGTSGASGGGLGDEMLDLDADETLGGVAGRSGLVSLTGSAAAAGRTTMNGTGGTKRRLSNGAGSGNGDGRSAKRTAYPRANLAVPRSVIEEAVRVARGYLELVCEVE